jgi:hypothetical protein
MATALKWICDRTTSPQSGTKSPVHVLDLYWRSPESGDLWYKSRQKKRHTVDNHDISIALELICQRTTVY